MKINILISKVMKVCTLILEQAYVSETEKSKRNNSKKNLHIMLKQAAGKKLRLQVWAYSLGEYLYILSKYGLTLKHRTYTINQTDNDLLE